MTGPDGSPVDAGADARPADAAAELRNVLDYMLDDHLKALESEAIAAAGSDPLAIERYRALQSRRRELQLRLRSSRSASLILRTSL
jgi:DNA primase